MTADAAALFTLVFIFGSSLVRRNCAARAGPSLKCRDARASRRAGGTRITHASEGEKMRPTFATSRGRGPGEPGPCGQDLSRRAGRERPVAAASKFFARGLL